MPSPRAAQGAPPPPDRTPAAPAVAVPAPPEVHAEAALWMPPSSARGHKRDVMQTLHAVPLFAELSRWQLRKVARLLHERSYEAREVVFREGDPGAGMYVVTRGEVSIVMRLPDGTEREITRLGKGQFFGEMALLESAPRSASAVATEQTELLGFFQPDLEALVERDSRLGSQLLWQLARMMASRLRATNEAMRRNASSDRGGAGGGGQ